MNKAELKYELEKAYGILEKVPADKFVRDSIVKNKDCMCAMRHLALIDKEQPFTFWAEHKLIKVDFFGTPLWGINDIGFVDKEGRPYATYEYRNSSDYKEDVLAALLLKYCEVNGIIEEGL